MLFLSPSQQCQSTIRAETLVCVAVIRKDSEKLSNNFDFRATDKEEVEALFWQHGRRGGYGQSVLVRTRAKDVLPNRTQAPKSPPAATEWSHLLLKDVICSDRVPFRHCRGDGSAQRVFAPGDLDL